MSTINIPAVMDAMAAQVQAATIAVGDGELRAYAWPVQTVNAPCFISGFPNVEFDATMARGADRAAFPAWVILGYVNARTAAAALAAIEAVKACLEERPPPAAWRSVRVRTADVQVVSIGETDYLGAVLDIDVIT